MAAHPQRMTPEQYLEIERAAEVRSEFYNGRMYAMSGGSYAHVLVIGNLAFALRSVLKSRPCSVATSDLRLRVSPGGLYTYPDVIAICGEPSFADDQKDTLLNPTLVAEVLSTSTEAYDRGFKSSQYRMIPSLQEYALVSQVEPRVEVFRRQGLGNWLLSEYAGLDAVCGLESLGCQIPLADIYEKVTFSGEEIIPPRPAAH